jgi:hypothetical protein
VLFWLASRVLASAGEVAAQFCGERSEHDETEEYCGADPGLLRSKPVSRTGEADEIIGANKAAFDARPVGAGDDEAIG